MMSMHKTFLFSFNQSIRFPQRSSYLQAVFPRLFPRKREESNNMPKTTQPRKTMPLSNIVLFAAASLSAATYICSAFFEKAGTSEIDRLSHLPGGGICHNKENVDAESPLFCPRELRGTGAGIDCNWGNIGAIKYNCTNDPVAIPTKRINNADTGTRESWVEMNPRPQCALPESHYVCMISGTGGKGTYLLIETPPPATGPNNDIVPSCGQYIDYKHPENAKNCPIVDPPGK
jgi:hypothetical protein